MISCVDDNSSRHFEELDLKTDVKAWHDHVWIKRIGQQNVFTFFTEFRFGEVITKKALIFSRLLLIVKNVPGIDNCSRIGFCNGTN